MNPTTAATLKALAAACPAARPAAPGDAVAGVMPSYAASVATVAEASALMRAAAEHDLAVVARGSGSRLAWGAAPQRCDLVVDTLQMNRVVEHAAGDLVARVQAGAGLDQLGEVLGSAGQQLALDRPPAGGGQPGAGTAPVGGGPPPRERGAWAPRAPPRAPGRSTRASRSVCRPRRQRAGRLASWTAAAAACASASR